MIAAVVAFSSQGMRTEGGTLTVAASAASGSSVIEEKAEAFAATARELPKPEAEQLAAPVLAQIHSGAIPVHLGVGAALLESEASAVAFSGGGSLVQVPIRGGTLVTPSNLSVLLDAESRVSKVIEIQYSAELPRNDLGRVTRWDGGNLVLDKVVDEHNNVSSPTAAAPDRSSVQEIKLAFSWSRFNSCLASQGIAAWTIAAIGVACGVVCAGTLGAGCAVCIAAAGGIGAGTVTYCIRRS